MLGRVVCLEHARLAFVGLREGVTSLLAHALHLSNFSNGFLELFHSGIILDVTVLLESEDVMLDLPWSVILNVVLLNLLDVVICLWLIHTFDVFPDKVAK